MHMYITYNHSPSLRGTQEDIYITDQSECAVFVYMYVCMYCIIVHMCAYHAYFNTLRHPRTA